MLIDIGELPTRSLADIEMDVLYRRVPVPKLSNRKPPNSLKIRTTARSE